MSMLLPPIYRDCRRLLIHTEESVKQFSRYHKYTVGTDLRKNAMQIMRGVHRAVYDKAQQSKHIETLVWLIDEYKLTLQLAMEIGAFVHPTKGKLSFAAFETAAVVAAEIGKQCGGWHQRSRTRVQESGGSPSLQKDGSFATATKECV
jgi:hypothetical protein